MPSLSSTARRREQGWRGDGGRVGETWRGARVEGLNWPQGGIRLSPPPASSKAHRSNLSLSLSFLRVHGERAHVAFCSLCMSFRRNRPFLPLCSWLTHNTSHAGLLLGSTCPAPPCFAFSQPIPFCPSPLLSHCRRTTDVRLCSSLRSFSSLVLRLRFHWASGGRRKACVVLTLVQGQQRGWRLCRACSALSRLQEREKEESRARGRYA